MMNKFLFLVASATVLFAFVHIAKANDESEYGMFLQ